MKYIRTKDRIREIIEDFGNSCNVKSIFPKGRPSIDNFTVVRGVMFAPRADTIEELFDEVVMVRNDEKIKPQLLRDWDKDDFSSFEKRLKTTNTQICGSIWVINNHSVPTLKPVAKMKGVLPNGEIDWELL